MNDHTPLTPPDQTATPVSVSNSAAQRIADIVADEPVTKMLRVSVEGGGCSGFQYRFELVAAHEPEDLVITHQQATVVIDPVSLPFLAGSEIDYVDSLIGASFQVRNPNATASCGCGTSFAV